jgi:hypothetical protein
VRVNAKRKTIMKLIPRGARLPRPPWLQSSLRKEIRKSYTTLLSPITVQNIDIALCVCLKDCGLHNQNY